MWEGDNVKKDVLVLSFIGKLLCLYMAERIFT